VDRRHTEAEAYETALPEGCVEDGTDYALGLELSDSGFDYSLLSEFRDRLLDGSVEELLLNKMLERFKALGYLKARGKQRTDST